MDANITAPTITIDGVTSKPGEPITFAKLICGDGFPILDGHVMVGDEVECDDCACPVMITEVFHTWKF